jgi:hypothetical protein
MTIARKWQEKKMFKYARDFGILILAFTMHSAFAGPNEDYKSGIEKFKEGDVVGAMTPLKLAADAGQPDAQALLGYILHQAGENEAAAAYLRKSAEQGNAEGQYGLSVMYASGDGVPKDIAESIKWMQYAAEQGNAKAINAMAQYFLSGVTPDPQSAEALSWIRRAAEINHIPSINALAAAYRDGRYGLAIDPVQAAQLEARSRKLRGLSDTPPKRK